MVAILVPDIPLRRPPGLRRLCDADHIDTPSSRHAGGGGRPIGTYRPKGRIRAVGSGCSHAGRPVEEGNVDDDASTEAFLGHHNVRRLADDGIGLRRRGR